MGLILVHHYLCVTTQGILLQVNFHQIQFCKWIGMECAGGGCYLDILLSSTKLLLFVAFPIPMFVGLEGQQSTPSTWSGMKSVQLIILIKLQCFVTVSLTD